MRITMRNRPARVPARALCSRFHRASELIGRRWTGAIIFVLLGSTCRFATLRDAIPDITDRMLSERLQELEQEGLVERTVAAGNARPRGVCAQQEREGPPAGDRGDRRLVAHLGRRQWRAGHGIHVESDLKSQSLKSEKTIQPSRAPQLRLAAGGEHSHVVHVYLADQHLGFALVSGWPRNDGGVRYAGL